MAIADLVKTTLGPKGMVSSFLEYVAYSFVWKDVRLWFDNILFMCVFKDKILQSTSRGHSVTVTNDGATILKSLHIDNPAAKVLVGILVIFFGGQWTIVYSRVRDLDSRHLKYLAFFP